MRAMRLRVLASELLAETSEGDRLDTARPLCLAGIAIVAIFFGCFGLWAILAPLNGAVVANAQVKIDGNRKAIQNLDGGTVRAIHVKDGDRVEIGDVLIEFDPTQAQADVSILEQQYLTLRFTEQRLRAEMSHSNELSPPDDITHTWATGAEALWHSQVELFDARRASLEGQSGVISEKIAQLEAEISGGQAQIDATKSQMASVKGEVESLRPLVDNGIITRPRFLQLQRSLAALEGQSGETTAAIARARQGIAEQRRLILQISTDRTTEAAKDLRDTQEKLAELLPKLTATRAVLDRTVIRSPYAGTVVALNVFSVGGVVARGEKILDLVPQGEGLVIEAMVNVEDISDVHAGDTAQVHLTAYKQRTLPIIHGVVRQVSADRLTDSHSGNPYYTAVITVDRNELADAPQLQLYPGMPATVIVPTVSRTAFDYLVSPLTNSFSRAFRER